MNIVNVEGCIEKPVLEIMWISVDGRFSHSGLAQCLLCIPCQQRQTLYL